MPINTDTPTIRPPAAGDLESGMTSAPTGTSIAPPTPCPTYEADPNSFRAEATSPELRNFASEGLAAPSRYDSKLISDVTGMIDADLANRKRYAGAELDEFASQRGLVGSNIELDARRSMIGDFERQRTERLTDLNLAAANSWAQDRSSAADIGFRSGEFERSLGGDRENANRFGFTAGEGQYEFDAGTTRQLNLQELNLQQQYGEQVTSRLQQQGQFEASLNEGIAGRLMQQGLRNRAMDLQQTGMNLDEAYRRAALEQETDIQNRSLELQELGLEKDDAYRYAALAQDARFMEVAQSLQAEGMASDEAYRRAALEMEDVHFQEANDQDRLRIVLDALSSGNVDNKRVRKWLDQLG